MQADAFLFEALVERRGRGDRRAARPTTGRCCRCASAVPTCGWSSSSPTGSTSRRSSACSSRGAEPKLAHIIPNFQNPAGYTLSAAKRERLLELAREHEFTIFEDDPYVALRFEGEPLPTMLSMDRRERRLRVVVLEDGLPRDPRRLPRRSRGADRADRRRSRPAPTSRRAWSRRRSSTSSAARARSSARSRPSRRRCASASRRSRRRFAASSPTPASSPPRGRLLPVGRAAPRNRRRQPCSPPPRERGVQFVKGSDFVLDGARVVAAARLLRRHAGRDRRGRQPARRCLRGGNRREERGCGLRRSTALGELAGDGGIAGADRAGFARCTAGIAARVFGRRTGRRARARSTTRSPSVPTTRRDSRRPVAARWRPARSA